MVVLRHLLFLQHPCHCWTTLSSNDVGRTSTTLMWFHNVIARSHCCDPARSPSFA
jgi:hypothetical protein